jgi:hypothetical protein
MHFGFVSAKEKSYGVPAVLVPVPQDCLKVCLPKDLQDAKLPVLRGHWDRILSLLLQFLHTAKYITRPQSDQP